MTDTTKTEALRLADLLEAAADNADMGRPKDKRSANRRAAAELRRLSFMEAERDRLVERLDRAIRAAEEHFGEDAIRHKLSLFKNGRARNVFPQQMDGQWFSFQRADNDAHVGLALRCAEAEQDRDRLAAECEALRACATKYLWWLNVKNPAKSLEQDITNPEMIGEAGKSETITAAMGGKESQGGNGSGQQTGDSNG